MNRLDFILDEVQIRQFFQMVYIFDVLDIVEAQIQTGKVWELVQSAYMGYQIIIEIQLPQSTTENTWEFNVANLVLPKAQFLLDLGVSAGH